MRKVSGPKYLLHSEGINVNHSEQSIDQMIYMDDDEVYYTRRPSL
jgi:hypothetical protein